MEAVIKLKVRELDSLFVEKLEGAFAANQDAVLTISIDGLNLSFEGNEIGYKDVLRRSKDDLENNRNLISFTMEELEAYANSKRS